jgi:hypothetical protein
MSIAMTTKKFQLGYLASTVNAFEALRQNNVTALSLLRRHLSGDWGTVCDEDAYINDMAVQDGGRILSSYLLPDETTVWIITDAEIDEEHTREATTILLPEDY